MNIMPKHEGQATVASREPQYWHSGASVDVAAPHIGQLSVSACISSILAGGLTLDYGLTPVRCWRRNSTQGKRSFMRRPTIVLFTVLMALPFVLASSAAGVTTDYLQDQNDQTRRKLDVPQRRRRTGGDISRLRHRRHRGIGHAYKSAGKSAGRGGKRFGKNMARGRPIRAGKEFGKGMGGFGKHTGKGTARTGKKVGKKVKTAVTP
jgi:hypothetical protein